MGKGGSIQKWLWKKAYIRKESDKDILDLIEWIKKWWHSKK